MDNSTGECFYKSYYNKFSNSFLNLKVALTILTLFTVLSPNFSQTCAFNVTLESVTYNNGQTTFRWSVQNTNPGNGSDGTTQDLSHWGFSLNQCINPENIVAGETNYGPDKSQTCTGATPIVKFDRGTSGTKLSYYQITLTGTYVAGTTTAYFKYSTTCCTKTIQGIAYPAPKVVSCPANQTIECPASPTFTRPTFSSDFDPNLSITFVDEKVTLSCGYKITRTWTAKDACGSTATCAQTITVLDKTAPVISGVGGAQTINCPANPVFSNPTVTDACSPNPTLTFADVKTTSTCGYSITRTWTAKDACGNASTASQTITVQDKTAPVISGVGSAQTIDCSATPAFSTPTVSDACSQNPTLTFADVKTTLSCGYSITRTWTAKDACGNTSTASQTITMQDKTTPIISGVGGAQTIDCSATPVFSTPTVTDACSENPTLTFADVKTTLTCGYSITRTWTATDACGNTSKKSQTITVQDKTGPVISGVGASQTLSCDGTPVFSTPTATDACSPDPTLTFADVKTTLNCGYSITRTWTAKDACGNTSKKSQTITVQDKTGPVISGVGGNQTLSCDGTPVFSTPTATDACSSNPTLTFADVKTTLSCGYSITRTWTATDACGNTSKKSQTITVQDKTGPVISGVGASQTLSCDGTPVFSTPTATDACSSNPTLTFADVKTTLSCGYSITRTWTATDACGNTSKKSQTITVQDKTGPVISGVGGNQTLSCDGTPVFSTPTATDACSPNPTLTFADVKTTLSCGYSITRTWTATDACGNTSKKSQTITMQDKTAPLISGVGANQTLDCAATPVFSTPTATDACSPNPTLTFADVKTTTSCGYAITRTWTAKDACGNTSTASQTITVQDKTGPVISGVGGAQTIDCSANPVFSTPTATDACSPNPTLTFADVKTTLSCGYKITRTWTAKDACGNTTTASQAITVQDKTAPVLTCVPNKTVSCGSTVTFDQPKVTDACDPNPTITIVSTVLNEEAHTRTWVAVDACGNKSATCSQTVTVQNCAHIFPTQTTCCNFITKTASPLQQVCYTPSGSTVSNAIPGVFFYYSNVVAPSANFTINVSQTNNLSSFTLFDPQNLQNVRLTDANCGNTINFTATITNKSQVTYNVTGATPGATYIVSVKYDSKSLIGSTFTGSAPSVDYLFRSYVTSSSGTKTYVSGSTGSITAKANCSDNTPAPGNCTQPSVSSTQGTTTNSGASSKTAKTVSADGSQTGEVLVVTAFPNPFDTKVTFVIRSTVSGTGTLDVYNSLGQKIKTLYQGYLKAGQPQTIDFNVPSSNRSNLMYILRQANRNVSGIVIKH